MSDPTRIQGFLSGGTVASPNSGEVLAIMVACAPGMIRSVACASNSGNGSTATIIDIRRNTISVYTNPASRPTLEAGKTGAFTSTIPNKRGVVPGDVLSVVCVQAGGHADVVATIAIEEP